MFYNTIGKILILVIATVGIYYIVKTLIERKVIIKNYNKSLIDIGEIVKK